MPRIIAMLALLCVWPGLAWGDSFEDAGARYGVNPALLRAISVVESGGNSRAVNINSNGSIDRGHMQINSQWWRDGRQVDGDALWDHDYCTAVGAWILAKCQTAYPSTWDAVSCYNTGASPDEWERRAAEAGNEKKRAYCLAMRDRAVAYTWKVYKALTGPRSKTRAVKHKTTPRHEEATSEQHSASTPLLANPFLNCR